MFVPLCNCYRHFPFLPSKTLLNPSSQISSGHDPKFSFKPLRRRVIIPVAAAETNNKTLSQSVIQRIAEKLRSLGYVDDESSDNTPTDETSNPGPNSPGEIFVPLPTRLPKYRVGHTLDTSWSTPENPVPGPGPSDTIHRFHELSRGVLDEEKKERNRNLSEGKRETAPSLAEVTLPEDELRRLRSIGIRLEKTLKVGKAGITEGIVNGIHERWRRSELVKITCEDICKLNMKRTHELLERKTGGLVIWRSGSKIVLYRGSNYKYPYFLTDKFSSASSSEEESADTDKGSTGLNPDTQISHPQLIKGVGLSNRVRFQLPGEAQLAEEANALLEGLGPRFTDWWGYDPLPIDADLLPAVVRGYKRPFRLLPYGVKPELTNDERTTLKRLGRPLPCHFALGRNGRHQGLAASIVKLWEKCELAKIALKRGVQNTNSLLMAEELKRLTGGTLLSRDKEFIVLYRGKDFLPAAVSSAIEERRRSEIDASKTRTCNSSISNTEELEHETKEYADAAERGGQNGQNLQTRSEKRKERFSKTAVERTSTKLSIALAKKVRAENLLAEPEKAEISQPPEADKESLTEEERYMLRRMGLSMKPILLLGHRGVFDGTVENMHLHWKYRELVKVCIGKGSIEEVHGVARTLEAESGGLLVAVEPVNKGFAIIVYRGKNYTRPASLRPRTLLSKGAAMKRSLEAQRRESLKLHVLKLSRNIDELKLRMAKDKDATGMQLTDDLEHGSVEEEVIGNHHSDGNNISHRDPESDAHSYSGDPADETRESHETDAISTAPEDPIHTSEGSVHIAQQLLPEDFSSDSVVKGNCLFNKSEADLQLRSLLEEIRGFPNINEQNVELSYYHRSQNQTSSSTTVHRDSNGDGYHNAELEQSVEKANEKPLVVPARALQLYNKERLFLRKQSPRMIEVPVRANGKSNVTTGVSKAGPKEHQSRR